MKKSIIFASKDFFIYNKEKYDFDNISEVSHLFRSNIKIVILEEDLLVKQFKNKINKFKLSKFVNNVINNDFPQNGDILYDYEKKNNNIMIYYIKGARRIERLAVDTKSIEVAPIQLLIKEAMIKTLKCNNFTCNALIKFEKVYYYIFFKEGLFDHGIVEENKEFVLNNLLKDCDAKKIYIDESAIDIVSSNNEMKFTKMNIRRFFDETIHEKQKFYSRKNSV